MVVAAATVVLGLLFLPRGVVLALWQGGPPSPWLWGAVLLLLVLQGKALWGKKG